MRTGDKVKVYFNLRTHLWSVVALDGPSKGLVIGHTERISLTGCVMKVSEKRRLAVVANKCREVHAWVIGTIAADSDLSANAQEFNYNPFRSPTFTLSDRVTPILEAKTTWFVGKKAYAK